MKNMFIFRLIDRLSAVKTHIMAVLCHSGFENVRHFREKYAVHVFVFIEDQFTILDENLSRGTPGRRCRDCFNLLVRLR